MINEFDKLTEEEQRIVLEAPVNVAILAAISDDGKVDKKETADAIKLAHLRTYTSPSQLQDLYKAIDNDFEANFKQAVKDIPAEFSMEEKIDFIKDRLKPIKDITDKIDRRTGELFIESLESFANHVFRSHSSFLSVGLVPILRPQMGDDLFED